jgi:predicted RNA polymerase sigma factor
VTTAETASEVEDLLRELAPQVLGVLARRYGDFDAAEDAVQEALLAAAVHWSRDGIPDKPRGWLIQTAARRLIDQRRSEQSRRNREGLAALEMAGDTEAGPRTTAPPPLARRAFRNGTTWPGSSPD